jgi:hypothetical protein
MLRRRAEGFYSNGVIAESQRGEHAKAQCLIYDEGFRSAVWKGLLPHEDVTVELMQTVVQECMGRFLNIPSHIKINRISQKCAINWLWGLGYESKNEAKTIYHDKHGADDVVQDLQERYLPERF